MKCVLFIPSLAIIGFVGAPLAWAAQKPESKSTAKSQFEQIKKLAGEWTGKAAFGEGAVTDNAKELAFKFFDGTNFDPAKDHHMRDLTIEFVDDDHIKTEWVSFNAGKKSHVAMFDLKRKR